MKNRKKKPLTAQGNVFVSILLVTQNHQQEIHQSLTQIYEICKKEFSYFEILIVDNGSTDDTVLKIRKLQKTFPHIRLIVLSRKHDNEISLFATLENSIGDYVILVDINTDLPSIIPRLYHKAIEGYDMVIAENISKEKTDNFFEQLLSNIYYRVATSIFQIKLSAGSSYTRILSRRALNSIIRIRSKSRFLKYINQLIGFSHTSITYSQRKASRKQHKSLLLRINTGINIIISNSLIPLRIATSIGVIASFLNLLFLIYVFVIILVKKQIAEGWISTSVMNASMFFILFLILSVISEYIVRILEESKDQPLYFIAEEYSSSVSSHDDEKLNVR